MSRPRKKNLHLPRCVHEKHGGLYYVKRGHWEHLGPASNLSACLDRYADLVQAAPTGGMPKLIADAIPVISRGLAASTAAQYAMAGKKLSKALAKFEPDQVQPKHLAVIKRAMAAKPNMANRVLTVARLVFSYALEEQLVSSNPAIGIKRHTEKKRDRLPLQSEIDAIKAHAGPRLCVIIELLRRCGQRTTNTLRIRESDIGEKGIQFPSQKHGETNIVEWTPGLRDAVAAARALHHPKIKSFYLLPARKHGKPPDYRSVYLQFSQACEAAGIEDLHLHDLRAMAATQAEEEGKNAQALLAHTTPQHTRRYLRGRKPKLVKGPEF